tara:strand:- start:3187 stop:3597 length:411 start_codon:yes stop_codon:yes gene_type:complete
MVKLRRIVSGIIGISTFVGLSFLTLESNINPASIAGRIGASCNTQSEIFRNYNNIRREYIKLKYITKSFIDHINYVFSDDVVDYYLNERENYIESVNNLADYNILWNEELKSIMDCHNKRLKHNSLLPSMKSNMMI